MVIAEVPPAEPRGSRLGHPTTRIELLGGFRLIRDGSPVAISAGSERLLAFLALHQRAQRRSVVAGTLWPEATNRRAHANLRASLTRLDPVSRDAIHVGPTELHLAADVVVDLHGARALARRLVGLDQRARSSDLDPVARGALSVDLLPGWYDEWVLAEAEDWRQLRLHAMEALVDRLTEAGRFAESISTALAAIRAEPLRETAHACLIRAHRAEGNRSEALQAFTNYARVLRAELGVEPAAWLHALLEGCTVGSPAAATVVA